MINKEMGKDESEVFLVYDPAECYYKLVLTKNNFMELKFDIEGLVS